MTIHSLTINRKEMYSCSPKNQRALLRGEYLTGSVYLYVISL